VTNRFQIEHVEAVAIRPLRHEVLRSDLPAVTTEFRGDDHPLVAHIAVRDADGDPPGEIVSVGTVFLEPPPWEPDRRDAWRIRGMATREGLRGLGLGRGVLDVLVEHASTHGGSFVWCHARIGALDFYRRSGFVPIGDVFDNGVVVHQSMWRALDVPLRSKYSKTVAILNEPEQP
jgi:GNAT superfamily N-acetyltransferase